ncbi:unnamed protein product [Oikopleura dioica]|uniref:Uncharacterized protein n=1 Tax=Oikopleura dioica TaxID=34765 RepID=E4Y296_OIKDI|nr:unnamed protein product [Oikopleura dioica]
MPCQNIQNECFSPRGLNFLPRDAPAWVNTLCVFRNCLFVPSDAAFVLLRSPLFFVCPALFFS